MSVQQLLITMCAEMPDAEINAIRKARGFSASETASRTAFASFFSTTIGLQQVFSALSAEEIFTLRLLNEIGEVDVAFFERLYGAGSQSATYTQRHKQTFDAVKKNLVRRGVLVIAEAKLRGEAVQMERWRFALPPEFAPHLPPLPGVQDLQSGHSEERLLRKKLLTLLGGEPPSPRDPHPFEIVEGSLYLNGKPFTLAALREWQISAWEIASASFTPAVPGSLSPVQAALKLLSPKRWTAAKDIEPALKIFCFGGKIPPADKLLHKGWELGLLSRQVIAGSVHYSLAAALQPAPEDQAYPAVLEWADTNTKPDAVKIDLRLAPLPDLAQLNLLARLQLDNGNLFAAPSLAKLGRAAPTQRAGGLSLWLAQHCPAFEKALETVSARWGKTLVHEDLLIARVRNLSLRVQLERELKGDIVVLNEHFIAFPLEARASVEKVLKKSGFVIKTVKP